MDIAVVSFFMKNIDKAIVDNQRRVVQRFLPPGATFFQIDTALSHGESLDAFVRMTAYDMLIFLDIDCIPTQSTSFDHLLQSAARGNLVGCAQRANHIKPKPGLLERALLRSGFRHRRADGAGTGSRGHVYAGPFCCAISRDVLNRIGPVSLRETERADVGEELTYAAEAAQVNVDLLMPSAVEEPKWDLIGDHRFGLGTTYENLFYHQFEIRTGRNVERFIERCQQLSVEAAGTPSAPLA